MKIFALISRPDRLYSCLVLRFLSVPTNFTHPSPPPTRFASLGTQHVASRGRGRRPRNTASPRHLARRRAAALGTCVRGAVQAAGDDGAGRRGNSKVPDLICSAMETPALCRWASATRAISCVSRRAVATIIFLWPSGACAGENYKQCQC